jgi:hypothetical protein
VPLLGRSWPQNRRRTTSAVYPVYEHGTTPPVVRSAIDASIATVSTATFTPPDGCLVVALLSFQWTARAAPTTLLANDSSGGGDWTVATHGEALATNYSQTAIFVKFFATSPGPITVSAGKAGTTACTMSLAVRCVMNAAPNQSTSGVFSTYKTATANALQNAVTAVAAGSLCYVVAAEDGNDTQTVNAATTTIDLWQNATDNAVNAIGKTRALTTGAGSQGPYGWTGGLSANDTAISVVEIVPVSSGATFTTYTKTGGGGPTSGVGGAKQVVSPIGGTFIEDVNAVVGTTTVTTGTFVAAPTTGDLAYCYAVNKPSSTAPPAPAGWTQISSVVVGTGVDGVGTGPVRITVWHQIVSGTFTSPTVTNSGTGAVIAAGLAYIRPNAALAGTLAVDHTTTSAQDLVDDATWSLTGGADLGVIAQDLVLTVDGWSNNIASAASLGSLSGPGITVASSSELTDTQLNVGNRGQMVANLFWSITGASTGAQTHAQTLNAAMTNRTGGTMFVRIRPLGTPVAVIYTKAGGSGGTAAPGGAKTVQKTLVNNLEGGTNGVTVTGANAGGAGNNLFDAISREAAAILAFDNTVAAHGSLALKCATTATPGAGAAVRWDATSLGIQNTIYARLYLYVTAVPASSARIFTAATTGGAVLSGGLYLMPDGTLELDAVGFLFATASPVNLNNWTRIELRIDGSTTAGYAELRLYRTADDTTATETRTTDNLRNTGGPVGLVDFGHSFDVKANVGPFWLDDLGVSNTDWLGPVGGGVSVVKAGAAARSGAPGGAKTVQAPVTSTKAGTSAAAAAGGGAKTVTAATVIYTKAGAGVPVGAPGGAEVRTTAATVTKAGTSAAAAAAGGAKAVASAATVTKAGAGAGVAAPGGAKIRATAATFTKAGTAVPAGAPGGAKTVQAPITSTKAGTAALAGGPGGARTVEHAKTGAGAAAAAPGGAKTVAAGAAIVKAGTSAAAAVGGGAKTVQPATTTAKAGTSAVAAAPGGAKVRTPAATVTKTGVSAAAAAPGGAKTVVVAGAIVKAGTGALAGVPGGGKTVLLPITTTKAGTAARSGAPGGAKQVTAAQIVAKAGTATVVGAPGGGKSVVGGAVIVKAGTAAAAAVSGGGKQVTAPITTVKAGAAAAVGVPGGLRSVEHSKTGAAAIGGAPGGVKTLAAPGSISKAGSGVAVGVPGGAARVQTGWLYGGSATDLDGGWVDLPGAVGPSTVDVPATNTGSGAAALTLEVAGFGADARVPYNAPLDPIAVWVRHAEDPPELFSAVQARVFVGATPVGAAQPLTVAAGEHDEIVWVSGLLYADLADLRVRVVATRS